MRSLAGATTRAWGAVLVVALLSADDWFAGRARIEAAVGEPNGPAAMTASDSRHYLEIANRLAAGDWSFSYVAPTDGTDLAHRQPLYPIVLAASIRLGHARLEQLAALNLAMLVAAIWVAYAIGARVFGSRMAGVSAAAVVWRVPFLFENATTRLLTEPGYLLCCLLAGWAFLAYARDPSARALAATACGLALAYLQRINGLVVATCALGVLLAADLAGTRRTGGLRAVAARWVGAVMLCVIVTTPSWLPRLRHAGNPFYHGYLTNFLWVDEYERAHVPGPPRYDWHDYAREHDLTAAVSRMGYGLRHALWDTPRAKYGDAVAAAMSVGILLVCLARDRVALMWLAVGVLQILPIAWIALADPQRRIPAAALLPFGIVAVAAGAAVVAKAASSVIFDRPAARKERDRSGLGL